AGAIAALTFTYSGYLTSFPVQQITILETAIWLPLVLFFLDRAFDSSRRWLEILLAALSLACALLAGHPQTALYVTYATLGYGLFLAGSCHLTAISSQSPPSEGRDLGQSVASRIGRRGWPLVVLFAVAIALAAVQLWPTWHFIAHSTRAGLDYDTISAGFELHELTHLLYPGYFGGSPQYVGILPLILIGAALLLRLARRQVVFWLIVGVVALLLSFGIDTFLYNVAYLLAPGFGAVRNQERIIYLFSFAVSVLAGYGALTLAQPIFHPARRGFRRLSRRLGWALAVLSVVTALFYAGYMQGLQQGIQINLFEGALRHHALLLMILAGSVALFALRLSGRARHWRMALALALIWLNLFTVNWQFNLAKPPVEQVFATTGLVDFLKRQQGAFRISSAGLLPGGPSAGIVHELEDITANTPLRLEAFQQFENEVGDWRRWQLLNVHYVVAKRDLDSQGLERIYEEDKIKIYRVSDPLPRAWVLYQAQVLDDDQALATLDAADFDPRTVATVSTADRPPALPAEGGPGEAATVVEAGPGRLVLDVTASRDGLLVISQPFYPGWRAQVDRHKAPIYRTDYLLQGVPVTAGTHRVELSYRLPLLPAIVSLAAAVGCLAYLLIQIPFRRLIWRRA
ncbi:MAG: YfhO family protein, partial [Anaerolineae bacterium]|nr:YfhO family protein [Anaerolineae bacterium]